MIKKVSFIVAIFFISQYCWADSITVRLLFLYLFCYSNKYILILIYNLFNSILVKSATKMKTQGCLLIIITSRNTWNAYLLRKNSFQVVLSGLQDHVVQAPTSIQL